MITQSAIMYPNGEVITARHHYQVIRIQAKLGVDSKDGIQGFVDHTGKFYTRNDARDVAVESGQLNDNHGTLYSEDLWPGKGDEVQE